MDYDFSHIPVGQPSRSLNLNSRWGIRTAYGQLIALVFVPICVLALVGATIILVESGRAAKAEQRAQAQAILARYEPVVRSLASILNKEGGQEEAKQILQSMLVESHLNRAAIIDVDGRERVHVGKGAHLDWPEFEKKRQFIDGLPSQMGRVYGVWGGLAYEGPVWLMVDMDNEPMRIAQYRVWLALAVTALITILLLLLCLNIYARRWIAPIYEMRMHLQHTSVDNLYQPMHVVSSGELNMLQRDIVFLLRRLHVNFQEIKEYAEQTEDDLRNAFDEMELQTISIRNARDAAVSASNAKSAFLANISHELRTPLNSIDGFINLLARKDDMSNEQRMYVETIRKSSAHLLALVNDVLDFSKIEAGKLVLEQQKIDLYGVIYDVVDMLTPLAAEKGIAMAVFYYEDVPTRIIADELRCKQILTNLVSNALKFTESGEVLVRVSLAEGVLPNQRKLKQEHIIISVQDSGKGVPASGRKHLFRSFSQADPSITRQYGGTGLGLVISKQLVQLMDGHIGHQDNAQEKISANGSTFWFSLPVPDAIEQPPLGAVDTPFKVLAWVQHEASMQVLAGLAMRLGLVLTRASSSVDLLDRLKNNNELDNGTPQEQYDWLIIDAEDDLGALIRGIREHYRGKVAAFGYQVSLDYDLLKQYQIQALYQPINRRSLIRLFQETLDIIDKPAQQWQGKQVLAVDDHLPNLMVLDALLSELGVGVTTVNSGADAIETFNRRSLEGKPFDLIFMDIQMPRMSGFEASVQIRSLEIQLFADQLDEKRTPIIALTAHALADERDKLLAAGVDDYVGKPISQPQLVAVLKKWFDGSDDHIDPEITLNGIAAITEQMERSYRESQPSIGRQTGYSSPRSNEHSTSVQHAKQTIDQHQNQVFNWEDALSRSANKADLAKDVFKLLLESLPMEKSELQTAWETGDINLLGQISHRIAGGSRYTGVPELRAASQRMQQQCISQQDADVEQAKATLLDSYHAVINAIDHLAEKSYNEWLQHVDSTAS